MLRLLAALWLLLCAGGAAAQPSAPATRPDLVVLVSIDGFRPQFLKRGLTPTLAALARDGVVAPDGMRSSFPTLTFPNHYTLVTGLRPDRHGIVANSFEDPARPGESFRYTDADDTADGRWWEGGEPIWTTAGKAGLRSATLFWPGSEAKIGGRRPDRWAHFDDAYPPERRVDMVLDWLDLPPGKRPDLVTLYFDQLDHDAHHDGPDSKAVDADLRRLDAAIARLIAGLKVRKVWKHTNLVLVADHGHAPASRDRVVFIDDWGLPAGAVRQIGGGPFGQYALSGPDAEAAALAMTAPHPHVTCWRRRDVPARLYYGANPRVADIVCLSDMGWEVSTREAAAKITHFSVGEHGWDPDEPLMHALFLAHGPAFRRGVRVASFDNVDIQPLLGRLLGVAVPQGDGSFAALAGGLRARDR